VRFHGPRDDRVGRPGRPDWGSSIVSSFLVALVRPELAATAIAGFLVRGGIVILLLPIVVLPTPAGIANVFAPLIVPFAFGLVSTPFLLVAGAMVGGVLLWAVLGGVIGAVADVVLIRSAAMDDELAAQRGWAFRATTPSRFVYGRAFIVRAFAHLPLLVVLAWSLVRIVSATYAELTTPFEVVTPLVIRVLANVPDAIAAVLAAWVLGEAAGGIGVRAVALDNASVGRAVFGGWLAIIRRPLTTLGTLLVGDIAIGLVLAVTFLATNIAWMFVEAAPLESDDPSLATLAVVVLVAVWLIGAALTGVATSFRSIAWTSEWLRVRGTEDAAGRPDDVRTVGTIGGDDDPRPGDWSSVGPSGTV
jgi:hypothetical protein